MRQPIPEVKIYNRRCLDIPQAVPTVTVTVGLRIEMMPWTDWWMRGARFGTVTNITKDGWLRIKLDKVRKKKLFPSQLVMTAEDVQP